jgi:hypothetical protein
MPIRGPTGDPKGPKGLGAAVNAGDKRVIPDEKPHATPVSFVTRDKRPPFMTKGTTGSGGNSVSPGVGQTGEN